MYVCVCVCNTCVYIVIHKRFKHARQCHLFTGVVTLGNALGNRLELYTKSLP